jgi:DNA-binding NarL/FixJ family response regulator
MRSINVVLAHHDPQVAQGLAEALRPHFRKVLTVCSFAEAEAAIARFRAKFVIADLELFSGAELKRLCSEFPSTAVTCVHRLADEVMWSEVLSVGAVDCCLPSDVRGILLASERYVAAAAAA